MKTREAHGVHEEPWIMGFSGSVGIFEIVGFPDHGFSMFFLNFIRLHVSFSS
jgi:hypothetical protein